MSLSQEWCFWILSQVSVATSTILTVFEGYNVPQDADLPALTSQRLGVSTIFCFCSNCVTGLLTINLINCGLFHQVFLYSMTQLFHCFYWLFWKFFWSLCGWHQIENENWFIPKQKQNNKIAHKHSNTVWYVLSVFWSCTQYSSKQSFRVTPPCVT